MATPFRIGASFFILEGDTTFVDANLELREFAFNTLTGQLNYRKDNGEIVLINTTGSEAILADGSVPWEADQSVGGFRFSDLAGIDGVGDNFIFDAVTSLGGVMVSNVDGGTLVLNRTALNEIDIDSGNLIGRLEFRGNGVLMSGGTPGNVGARIEAVASADWGIGSFPTDLDFYTAFSPAAKVATMNSTGLTMASGKIVNADHLLIVDGITAPSLTAGFAKLYVDTTDGFLKVIYDDGTIEPIDPTGANIFSQDTKGVVPGPTSGEIAAETVLGADGTWVSNVSTIFAQDINGSVVGPTSGEIASNFILRADNTWISNTSINFAQDLDGSVIGPSAAEISANKILQADNTWIDQFSPVTFSQDTDGYVPGPSSGDIASNFILQADGSWISNTSVNFAQDIDGSVVGPTLAEISANKILRADNTWIDEFSPVVFSVGVDGYVTGPLSGDVSANRLLQADNTWVDPFTPVVFSQDINGYVVGPTLAEIAANKILQADNTWIDQFVPVVFSQDTNGYVVGPTALEISSNFILRADNTWVISGGSETLAQTLALGNVTGGTDLEISSGDSIVTASDVAGVDLSVLLGDGSAGLGGTFKVTAGAGNGVFRGGSIDLEAGIAGNLSVGGFINLIGGIGGSTSGEGGDINITGGNAGATNEDAGRVFIEGGNASGTGIKGAIVLQLSGDGGVVIGGSVDNSAVLTIHSTTQGLLKPRLTTTQRDAISSPATGLEIYNTITNLPEYFDGSSWTSPSGTPGGSDTEVQYNNGGVFGGMASLTYNDSTGAITLNATSSSTADVIINWDSGIALFIDAANGNVNIGSSTVFTDSDLTLDKNGWLTLKETATPTSTTNYGKVYTKNDNSLYFQDGAGSEHTIGLDIVSASPGGSDTQVQYNNGGSFGGMTALTYNDSTGVITANATSNATADFIVNWDSGIAFHVDAATGFIGVGNNIPSTEFDVTGDMHISGNLIVDGSKIINNLESVNIADNHLYMNAGYETTVAQTGGLVVNYLPTSTVDTVSSGAFVAGDDGVSNPTVTTVGSATFSIGDLIQISLSNNGENNGLYEVLSHSGTLLTIRGIGLTSTVEDFTDNDFAANASDNANITKVTVSVIRAGTDGLWETASGSATGFSFQDLAVGSTNPGGSDTQVQYNNGGTFGGMAAMTFNDSSGVITLNAASTSLADVIINWDSGVAFFMNAATGEIGMGTTSPDGPLHVIMPGSREPLFERTASFTNIRGGVLGVKHTTTANMVDGFGAQFSFFIEDVAAVSNRIAAIAGIRDGADNEGKLQFYVGTNAGSLAFELDSSSRATFSGVVQQTTFEGEQTFLVTTTATGTVPGATIYRQVTSGNMVDGFGITTRYQIEDATSGVQNIGRIQFTRDGADNEGKFILMAGTNGLEEFFSINSAGVTTFNTTSISTADFVLNWDSGVSFFMDAATGNVGIGSTNTDIISLGSTWTGLTIFHEAGSGGGFLEIASGGVDSSGDSTGIITFNNGQVSVGNGQIAILKAELQGSTATNRGGRLRYGTKKNGSTGLVFHFDLSETGTTTFNASSVVDADFQINWNSGKAMFLDSATGNIEFGEGTAAQDFQVTRSRNGSNVVLAVDNTFVAASSLDETCEIRGSFNGSPAWRILAGKDADYTSGANQSGNFSLQTRLAGSNNIQLTISSTGATVFNTSSLADGDFTVNWDSGVAFFMDATDGQIALGHNSPTSALDVAGDVEVGNTDAYYMGDPTTDGTWRFLRVGNDLDIQKRVAGTYVSKSLIS